MVAAEHQGNKNMKIIDKPELAELPEAQYLETIAFSHGTQVAVAEGDNGRWRMHTRPTGGGGTTTKFHVRRTGVQVGKAQVNRVWEIHVRQAPNGSVELHSAAFDVIDASHPELAKWIFESIRHYFDKPDASDQTGRIDMAKNSFVAEHGGVPEPETVGLDDQFDKNLNDEIAKELGNMEKDEKMKVGAHEVGEAAKFDDGKVRHELLPRELLVGTAKVLTYGAKKYEDRNWEKGMSWGRVYGAMQRHLVAWWARDETDGETGFSHLWHASCCLAFLIAYEARGIGKDDRPHV